MAKWAIGGFKDHPGAFKPGHISDTNKFVCGSLKKDGETRVKVIGGHIMVNLKDRSYRVTEQANVKKEIPTKNGDHVRLDFARDSEYGYGDTYLDIKFKPEKKYCYEKYYRGMSGGGHGES